MNERQIQQYQRRALERAVWDPRQIAAIPEIFPWLEPGVRVGLSVNK